MVSRGRFFHALHGVFLPFPRLTTGARFRVGMPGRVAAYPFIRGHLLAGSYTGSPRTLARRGGPYRQVAEDEALAAREAEAAGADLHDILALEIDRFSRMGVRVAGLHLALAAPDGEGVAVVPSSIVKEALAAPRMLGEGQAARLDSLHARGRSPISRVGSARMALPAFSSASRSS